jgi:signal transduction histidine kinase
VKVWFNVVKDNLFLEVNDDGNGFDPKQKRSGIGIANMTSRADNIGGELFIESAPRRGCTLKAQFPLKHKASV